MYRRFFITLSFLISTLSLAHAAELRWHVTNTTPWKAQIEFYSEDRSHERPGNNQAWDLNDDDTHTFTLKC